MIDLNRDRVLNHYEVALGHSRVRVHGLDREDAVRQARIALGAQLPRLYDIIERAEPGRFQVKMLAPQAS